MLLILLSLSLMGDPGGRGKRRRSTFPLKKIGPFLHVGGGTFFSFYVEIYLDVSPFTKFSGGVYAFAIRVVPNILEHISYNVEKINEMMLMIIALY